MSYQNKYLKYKNKYLKLKNMYGGITDVPHLNPDGNINTGFLTELERAFNSVNQPEGQRNLLSIISRPAAISFHPHSNLYKETVSYFFNNGRIQYLPIILRNNNDSDHYKAIKNNIRERLDDKYGELLNLYNNQT